MSAQFAPGSTCPRTTTLAGRVAQKVQLCPRSVRRRLEAALRSQTFSPFAGGRRLRTRPAAPHGGSKPHENLSEAGRGRAGGSTLHAAARCNRFDWRILGTNRSRPQRGEQERASFPQILIGKVGVDIKNRPFQIRRRFVSAHGVFNSEPCGISILEYICSPSVVLLRPFLPPQSSAGGFVSIDCAARLRRSLFGD